MFIAVLAREPNEIPSFWGEEMFIESKPSIKLFRADENLKC